MEAGCYGYITNYTSTENILSALPSIEQIKIGANLKKNYTKMF